MNKKPIIIFADIIFPIVIFALALFFQLSGNIGEHEEFGEHAFTLLFLLLIIKPISILFPKFKIVKSLMPYRREIGHLVFYLALVHGLFELYNRNFLINELYLVFGVMGLVILTVMFLTSNSWAYKALGKWWKRLHSLIYVVLILAYLHVVFITLSNFEFRYLIMGLIVLGLKVSEKIKLNKN